jgi:hypothetical protein
MKPHFKKMQAAATFRDDAVLTFTGTNLIFCDLKIDNLF